MSAMKKEPVKPEKVPVFKWEAGQNYKCIMSKSPGYKLGEVYTAYQNSKGHLCLKGRDGFEDLCTMLVSSFKRV